MKMISLVADMKSWLLIEEKYALPETAQKLSQKK
jgi:hypothetical protein